MRIGWLASRRELRFEQTRIERHRGCEDLERRAHFRRPPAVMRFSRSFSWALKGLLGIEVGQRHHRHYLAGARIDDPPPPPPPRRGTGADGVVAPPSPGPARRARCAGPRRSSDSRTGSRLPSSTRPQRPQFGEPLVVDPLLHAGNAVIVDIDEAEHMRSGPAPPLIEAPPSRSGRPIPGMPRSMIACLLARRQLAAQPQSRSLPPCSAGD